MTDVKLDHPGGQLSMPVREAVEGPGGIDVSSLLKETGCAGIMVGRGALGNPWIFREINEALAGMPITPRPALKDRVAVAVKQFELAEQDLGEHIACLQARKHFAWYLRGVPHSSFYKNEISSLNTMEDIYRVARDIVRDLG